MKKLLIISIIIIIVAFIVYWVYYRKSAEHMTGAKNTISLYYSPECPHCHDFMPEWDAFANFVNKEPNVPVSAIKVNCKANPKGCKNISGYPTVILHKENGTDYVFNGQRTAKALGDFVKSQF